MLKPDRGIRRAIVARVKKAGYPCVYHPRTDTVSLNGLPPRPWHEMKDDLWALQSAQSRHEVNLMNQAIEALTTDRPQA